MTRDEKLTKLANAIRKYRGMYQPQSKKWIHAPDYNALSRVRRWLEELNLNANVQIAQINNFNTFPEFTAWLKALDEKPK